MGLFENFPYVNFHELNLDWILHKLKELETEITNFVAINSVKYANPITWDITSQYETNTVVLDSSGNAYLSVQPVPAGVSLDREEYWTKIGNFSALWDSVRSAITPYDEQHSTTASVDHKAGDWVWLENDLLLITKNITAGDKYVDGSNCKKTNVHDLFTTLGDELQDEITNRENADNTLDQKITAESTARSEADNTLDQKITAEATARSEADTVLEEKIKFAGNAFVNVRNFGAVGDAAYFDKDTRLWYKDSSKAERPTSDVAAFEAAIQYALDNNIGTIFIPNGKYYLPNKSFTFAAEKIRLLGETNSSLISEGLTDGSFITFTSTQATNYDFNKMLLSNIKLWGCYDEDKQNPTKRVTGIYLTGGDYFMHTTMFAVDIQYFNVGFRGGRGCYKLGLYDLTVTACDNGIFIDNEYSAAVPMHFYNLCVDVCAAGIVLSVGGGASISVVGGSIEHCHKFVYTLGIVNFTNVRFEWDLLYNYDDNGNSAEAFTAATSDLANIVFNNCDFYTLASKGGNVKYFYPNTHDAESIANYTFTATSDSSRLQPAISFSDCSLITSQCPASHYLVYSPSGCMVNGIRILEDPSPFMICNTNNIVDVSSGNFDVGFAGFTYNGANMKAGEGAKFEFSVNPGDMFIALFNCVVAGNVTIKATKGTSVTTITTESIGTGWSRTILRVPAGFNKIEMDFATDFEMTRDFNIQKI